MTQLQRERVFYQVNNPIRGNHDEHTNNSPQHMLYTFLSSLFTLSIPNKQSHAPEEIQKTESRQQEYNWINYKGINPVEECFKSHEDSDLVTRAH